MTQGNAPPMGRRTLLGRLTLGAGLVGAVGLAAVAAPRVIRRFDRLDPSSFALPALDGTAPGLASADLRGAPAIICFWASWCPECLGEHDRLVTLAKAGVRLIGVASLDDGPRAAAFLRREGDPFERVALDARGALLRGFGFRGVPGFLVLGRDGERRFAHEGVLDDALLARKMLPAFHAA